MSSTVKLIPIGETRKAGADSARWLSSSGKAGFDISIPEGVFPVGWVLFQGSLVRRGGDYDARLYYDLGEGFGENRFFEIPTSAKGVIDELICLPANIRRMKFSPMGTAGEFEPGTLTITKVGALERRWRMVRRIVAMIFLHSNQKRKLIKLTFFRMLVDLQGAYKIAGKLQAHAAAPQYQDWIMQFDALTADDRARINEHISRYTNPPHFHLLIVPDGAVTNAVQKTLDSLNEQLYRRSTCVLLEVGEGGEYVFDLDVGMNADGPLGAGRVSTRHVGLKPDLQNNVTSVGLKPDLRNNVAQDRVAAWLEQFNATLADSKAGDYLSKLGGMRVGDSA